VLNDLYLPSDLVKEFNICSGFLRSRRDKRKEKKTKKKKDSSGETVGKEDKSDK